MAERTLILWLDGPLQSWGTRARWDVRDTGPEPTKSGIVGLVACALGIPRRDPALESLDQSMLFGVRVDKPGIVATDFHTVTGFHRTAAGDFKHGGGTASKLASAYPHGPYTIVSPRDYLHDAAFMVALQVEDALANKMAEALSSPKWPLFLGRKSCPPTRPPLDREAPSYPNLEEALSLHPRHARAAKGGLTAYIEDPSGPLERQDSLANNMLRLYGFRRCRYMEVNPPCSLPVSP